MFKSLIEKNERRSQLSIMAQYLNTCFMISTVDDEYLISIEKLIVTTGFAVKFLAPKT